jgi:hypothetical protein
MSNVDRLHHAGVLDPGVLSQEHKDFINHHMTHEEVEHLIKGGHKLAEYARKHGGVCIPTVTV